MSAVVTITISIVVNDGGVAVHTQTADGNPLGESSRLANPIPEVPAGEEAGNTGGCHDAGLTTLDAEVARVVPPSSAPVTTPSPEAPRPELPRVTERVVRDSLLEMERAAFPTNEIGDGLDIPAFLRRVRG